MRGSFISHLAIGLLLLTSAGCVRQGAHSLRRMWADFNTLNEPALFWEQSDHLPYHRDRVAQFRWGYGKDPGHQYSGLQFDPPRPPVSEEEPAPEPVGLSLTPESLWRAGLPTPIDTPQSFEPLTTLPGNGVVLPGPGLPSIGGERLPAGAPRDGELPPVPSPAVPDLPPPLNGSGGSQPSGPSLGPIKVPDRSPGLPQGAPLESKPLDGHPGVRLTSTDGKPAEKQPAARGRRSSGHAASRRTTQNRFDDWRTFFGWSHRARGG